jgi:hypothetical protein
LGAERRANRDDGHEKKDSYHRGIISQIIEAEAKGFIQQGLLLTVHFVFGQRGECFDCRLMDVALTFKLSANSL